MRNTKRMVALGCCLILCIGCNRATDDTLSKVEPIDQMELVKGNNQFAVELYNRVAQKPGNLFLSPYSISTGLAMTYAGARTTTAEQMARTLHFPADARRLPPAFAAVRKELMDEKARGYEFRSANALWLHQGFRLEADFVETVSKNYGGQVRQVDFAGGGEVARNAINDWVAIETREKIKEVVQKEDLTPLTRLVLTNAIYFKGDWAAQFPKAGTRTRNFYRKNGDHVPVPTMAQCATFPYWEDDATQVAEFPYVGKQLAMLVVLPRSAEGLPAVEKTLTSDQIAEWAGKLQETRINVYLPRFRSRLRLDLTEPLSALGMPIAFDPDGADFAGQTGPDPQNKLHVSKVIHEAVVEITEEGTEAAGATGVIEVAKSAPGMSSPRVPPTFCADRPFLFVIRETRLGSILFIGRMTDPSRGP